MSYKEEIITWRKNREKELSEGIIIVVSVKTETLW